MEQYKSASPELTGGDIDARWDQAEAVGDEAVGGTAPTPDQSIVEEKERFITKSLFAINCKT